MTPKLTKRRREVLGVMADGLAARRRIGSGWVVVCRGRVAYVLLATLRPLLDSRLVAIDHAPEHDVDYTYYRITDAGRKALKESR